MLDKFKFTLESWVFNSDKGDFDWIEGGQPTLGGRYKQGSSIVTADVDPSDLDSVFYQKYGRILNKEFDSSGNIKSSFKYMSPVVLAVLTAIENGDHIPPAILAEFTGLNNRVAAGNILSKMLSRGFSDTMFPKEIVTSYLKYGNYSGRVYSVLKERFPNLIPQAVNKSFIRKLKTNKKVAHSIGALE